MVEVLSSNAMLSVRHHSHLQDSSFHSMLAMTWISVTTTTRCRDKPTSVICHSSLVTRSSLAARSLGSLSYLFNTRHYVSSNHICIVTAVTHHLWVPLGRQQESRGVMFYTWTSLPSTL